MDVIRRKFFHVLTLAGIFEKKKKKQEKTESEIQIMKLNYLIFILAFLSCNNSKKDNSESKVETKMEMTNQNDEIFLGKVVIILSEELNDSSNVINIQDYIKNGKSFIPIFSSIEKFNESTKGNVKNPKIEIDGIFLLSILNGKETLKLNPGLEDETIFKSELLIKKYSEKIEKLKIKMENLNRNK